MAQVHTFQHRVTYSECTVGNHVYYGRYLDFLEGARGEFLRAIGFPLVDLHGSDTAFPVVECCLRYASPARYDELLLIQTWIAGLHRVRLRFAHRILGPDRQDVLEAETLHACTSLRDKPKRIPEDLRAALLPWMAKDAPHLSVRPG